MSFESRIFQGRIEADGIKFYLALDETKVFKNDVQNNDEPTSLHFKRAVITEKIMDKNGLSVGQRVEAITWPTITDTGYSLEVVGIVNKPTSPSPHH